MVTESNHWGFMADKVMVFETDLEIEQRIAGLLFDAGYEVSPHCAGDTGISARRGDLGRGAPEARLLRSALRDQELGSNQEHPSHSRSAGRFWREQSGIGPRC